MDENFFNTSNTLIQLMMVLKMQQLNRTQLPTLTYSNLEDYLNECLWRNGCPLSLHESVNQIINVNANDIVRFLSTKAIIDGSKCNLEDFSDILGGN